MRWARCASFFSIRLRTKQRNSLAAERWRRVVVPGACFSKAAPTSLLAISRTSRWHIKSGSSRKLFFFTIVRPRKIRIRECSRESSLVALMFLHNQKRLVWLMNIVLSLGQPLPEQA